MPNDKSTHAVSPESVAAVNQLVPMDVSGRMCLDDGKPKTLSVMILDRSGSMAKYGDTPQKCVNDHLAAIKNPPDGREQFVTVITFADDAKIEIPVSPAATAAVRSASATVYFTVTETESCAHRSWAPDAGDQSAINTDDTVVGSGDGVGGVGVGGPGAAGLSFQISGSSEILPWPALKSVLEK